MKAVQAVLFDLDDTLLYTNMDTIHTGFLRHYFALLGEFARPLAAPHTFMAALMGATEAMTAKADPAATNEQAFAAVFAPALGRPWEELRPLFARFYEESFPDLKGHTHPHPDARRVVQSCLDGGYRVAIATNPLFPSRAVEHRLEWAGLSPRSFELITTYENMHTCKPYPDYYREIAGLLRLPTGACVMVGNDIKADILPAHAAGMRTFLADRWLSGDSRSASPEGRGSLADFLEWLARFSRPE